MEVKIEIPLSGEVETTDAVVWTRVLPDWADSFRVCQEDNLCWAACAEMVYRYYGVTNERFSQASLSQRIRGATNDAGTAVSILNCFSHPKAKNPVTKLTGGFLGGSVLSELLTNENGERFRLFAEVESTIYPGDIAIQNLSQNLKTGGISILAVFHHAYVIIGRRDMYIRNRLMETSLIYIDPLCSDAKEALTLSEIRQAIDGFVINVSAIPRGLLKGLRNRIWTGTVGRDLKR